MLVRLLTSACISQARLHAIQLDVGTYCDEPTGPWEKFEEWLRGFDLESKKRDISLLLVANVDVRSLYTQLVRSLSSSQSVCMSPELWICTSTNLLVAASGFPQVPSVVSHADFWARYYYKVFQLEEDEARKAELMRRAEVISQQREEGWDEDGRLNGY